MANQSDVISGTSAEHHGKQLRTIIERIVSNIAGDKATPTNACHAIVASDENTHADVQKMSAGRVPPRCPVRPAIVPVGRTTGP